MQSVVVLNSSDLTLRTTGRLMTKMCALFNYDVIVETYGNCSKITNDKHYITNIINNF